ncbi:hypothetical protein BDV98DRAFT_593255 [Pterulicium gracile]|uniref:Uncharacterized protein n=1 Tax=Pterulicium gracile TaxID=1884261 RepID=A0A5C3QH74_9AGAR|nr:hypothetical protein BDV98DRAFT_593255 [Pterula gracilis]
MPLQEPRLPAELLDEVLSHTQHLPEDDLASEHRYRKEFWLPLSLACMHFRNQTLPVLFSSIMVEKIARNEVHLFDLDVTRPSTMAFCCAVAAGDAIACRLARYVKTFTIRTIDPATGLKSSHHTRLPPVYVKAIGHMRCLESIFIWGIAPGRLLGKGFLDVLPNLSKLSTL